MFRCWDLKIQGDFLRCSEHFSGPGLAELLRTFVLAARCKSAKPVTRLRVTLNPFFCI